MTQEALRMALEAFYQIFESTPPYRDDGTFVINDKSVELSNKAIAAIKEALAHPEPEPWCMKRNGCKTKCEDCPDEPPDICCQQYDTCLKPCTPRGVHLAQRTWVGLIDKDMNEPKTHIFDFIAGARWAESILKERNT